MTSLIWYRREPPLQAAAVLARDGVVPLLARRVAADGDPSRFRAVAATGWLVVLAAAEDLPWVPGVRYLGWDGALLLPTTHRPGISTDLLARVLGRNGVHGLTVLLADAVLRAPMPSLPVDIVGLEALR